VKKFNPIFLILFFLTLAACGKADLEAQNDDSGQSPEIVSPNQNAGAAELPAGMVSLNYDRLSANYANLRWSASYVQSAFLRVPTNYQFNGQNYTDVLLPVSDNSHAGSMKIRLPAQTNVFTMYYRDWANHLNKKEIKIDRAS